MKARSYGAIAFIFTVVSLLFLLVLPASADALEQERSEKPPAIPEISDGIYNIVNVQTGKYLDVFDLTYDPDGQAYLDRETGEDGQLFLIVRQDDGKFIIAPQSENGIYYLSYADDIMISDRIVKKAGRSGAAEFEITINEEGVSRIKPYGMRDRALSLGISSSRAPNGAQYAAILFDSGKDSSTEWSLIKVSDSVLRFSRGYIGLRKGMNFSLKNCLSSDYIYGSLSWQSSDPDVARVDFTGNVTALNDGTAVITVKNGEASASCTVRVSGRTAYTWYSQHNVTEGGWYAEPVADLRLTTSFGASKLFFINGYNRDADWMDEGCKLCSEAMVLHNLGAKMDGYDVRYGVSGLIEADPYTVMLANTGLSGHDVENERILYEPVMIVNRFINSRFEVNGRTVSTSVVYSNSPRTIRDLLVDHPEGVIVEFNNYGRDIRHYAVFTECLNPDDPNGDYRFLVCDSSAVNAEEGDNVPFEDSYMYARIGYRFYNMTSVQYYTVENTFFER